MTAVETPLGVTGLLAEFAAAGLLLPSDVRVALTLGRLAGESDDAVLLAAALTVRALRLGSVCVDLTEARAGAVPEPLLDGDLPTPAPAGLAPNDHVRYGHAGLARSIGRGKHDDSGQGTICAGRPTVQGRADAPDAPDAPDVHALPWPEIEQWIEACRRSPMVSLQPPPPIWLQRPRGPARPLFLDGPRLYLDRYAQLEHLVRTVLTQRAGREPPAVDPGHLQVVLAALDDVPDDDGPSPDQRLAVAAAVTGWVSVVAGGPGTGKTWTVAALLASLERLARQQGASTPRVALVAPTGKAAARMQEQTGGRHEAMTIHRLLGYQPWRGTRFAHDWQNRLPYDVVVVDETSMVSLELMARLLEALPTTCRLVLVGDPDQLASIDAGAVLADLVERPERPAPDGREALLERCLPADVTASPLADEGTVRAELRRDLVRLRHNRRAEKAIARLGEAIRRGDADAVVGVLSAAPRHDETPTDASDEGSVEWVPEDPGGRHGLGHLDRLQDDVVRSGAAMVRAARRGDAGTALTHLGRHRLLCAHRAGAYGVTRWRDLAASWISAVVGSGWQGDEQTFAVGRPLLVVENDRALGLSNGDAGVVVADGDGVLAVFDRGGGHLLRVPVSRLPAVQTPLAMTVHKAQGSEADRVSVVLPPAESPLLTRELLYTAVTRARHLVRVVGTEDAVRAAVARRVVRASGLRDGWV